MKTLNYLKRKIKMFRLRSSFPKDERKTFSILTKHNYNKLLDDDVAGADYIGEIKFNSAAAQKARLIREALDNGIDPNLLLRRKLNADQMDQILHGLQSGLSINDVKKYAKPKFNARQMEQIRIGLESGISRSQMDFFAEPGFASGQMEQIRTAITEQASPHLIRLLARPAMHPAAMKALRQAFNENSSATPSELQQLSEKLCYASTFAMSCGIDYGISPDVIHGIIDKLTQLRNYWDKDQYRELTREICEEISENRISDLDQYFSEKFVTDEPQLPATDDEEKINDPEPTQENPDDPSPENVKKIDINAIDQQLKKESGHQTTAPQADADEEKAAQGKIDNSKLKAPAAEVEVAF